MIKIPTYKTSEEYFALVLGLKKPVEKQDEILEIMSELFKDEGKFSKKIKNYLQLGNKLHINHTFKIEGKIGYFKVEILKALTPLYFDNKKKLMCLAAAMNLIKLLTVESQENSNIFKLIDKFFMILTKKNWIKEYVFWELKLLKLIGYGLELKNLVNREVINNETKYSKNKS